ncbi:neurotoxin 3FTx-RI isoform X1 [Larimichthys crocea]|uniref:Drtp1 n=1 Tax=Larimichthys crocea TaxID=215358 RepID=Q1PD41_LARCR|nr:neurotoxin 3FTx-RI-like isoform X1 [Larimichthys crocea]ABE02825.1 drtp1 [Larimichthys crocea]
MKTVILALLVLMAVSQTEALKCNCAGLRGCPKPVETCYNENEVCGSVTFSSASNPSFFKGCMPLRDCVLMNRQGASTARCCKTDQCNP